jgi:hypothetical protein
VAAQYLKGALISFMPTLAGSTPNVIVFQYNPETITHTWTAAGQSGSATSPKAGVNPRAADYIPGESFSFKLFLDGKDMIADGATNPVAAAVASVSGVYTRLAALEMLQYPSGAAGGPALVGTVSASISAAGVSASVTGGTSTQNTTVPRSVVPMALFVWGPQRILPVRVTSLSVTETMYDTLLNPIQAEVSITLQVITPPELSPPVGELTQIGLVAYNYTQALRQANAIANLGDAAATIMGMLPTSF